jgi:hypothetical protein
MRTIRNIRQEILPIWAFVNKELAEDKGKKKYQTYIFFPVSAVTNNTLAAITSAIFPHNIDNTTRIVHPQTNI